MSIRRTQQREKCWKAHILWGWLSLVLCVVGVCVGSEALATPQKQQTQLLFEVKTNHDPNQVYQFFALTQGADRRLVGLRYYRKSLIRAQVSKRQAGQGASRKWVVGPCYPYRISFAQIRKGVPIFRKSPVPQLSTQLQQLIQRKREGKQLSLGEQAQYSAGLSQYCRELNQKSRKGRFINSIRGYGLTRGEPLDPVRGGHIVVTYLRNGLLNFFRGDYRYVVLKISKVGGRWRLQTAHGKSAQRLFFRTYSLGVSAIENGFVKGAKALPSRPCRRWIDKQVGTCRLTTIQRISLPRG